VGNAEAMPTCAVRKLLDLLGAGEARSSWPARMRAMLPS
jgi:hypothetical protein